MSSQNSLKADFVLGHAKSDFNNPIQTTLTLDQLNVQGYSYDYSQGRVPRLSYGSANLTSPAAWALTQVRERPQTAVNTCDAGEVNLHFAPSEVIKFAGGLDDKKYEFTWAERRRSIGTTANQEAVLPAALAAIPLSSYSTLTSLNTSGLGAPVRHHGDLARPQPLGGEQRL